MADSNGTSNDGPPYKESNTIAGHTIEGIVEIVNGVIHITRQDNVVVPLHMILERFGLPRELRIEITTPHRKSVS